MTTSRDPEKPSKGGKSSPKKGSRAPLSRRLRYFVQDAGYAAKKAGRRVADPVRDSRKKAPRRKPKPAKPTAKPAPKPKREPKPAAAQREEPAKPSPSDARRERKRKPRRPRVRLRRPRGEHARKGARAPKPTRSRGRVSRPTASGVAAAITNFGERCSRIIRAAVAPLLVPLVGLASLGRRGLTWLAAALTPLRGALVVSVLAAVLLGVSQFVDYRGVAVGVPEYAAYSDAELVAPAPEVDREPTGSAHAYLLVPVAALAIALLVLAARGRWQLGRVVSLLGVLGIAIALVVDVPAGLDESAQAIAYAGVEAHLIEGFWVQIVSAGVLVCGGLLVSRYARRARKRAPRRRRASAPVTPARAKTA